MIETAMEIDAELKSLAKELNAESDALTQTINELNQKLSKLSIGIEVFSGHPVNVEASDTDRGEHAEYLRCWELGYAKVRGEDGWCLVARPTLKTVQLFDDRTGDPLPAPEENQWTDEEPVALSRAPREVRIALGPRLPDLMGEIKRAVKYKIDALKKARSKID